MKHLIDPTDLTRAETDEIVALGEAMYANPAAYAETMRHKKLGTLFYEPSTRTRLSFTAAMMELGGNVLGFADATNASVAKGESVGDTARVISCFADILAIRHPLEGAPFEASMTSLVPVINAGDGSHNHPTQTLTDLITIQKELGRLDHLTVGCCGDLRYGRTVHSLIKAMARYEGVRFVLISPEELRLPEDFRREVCEKGGIACREVTSIEEAISDLDVLYMTRVQKERFPSQEEYERVKDCFVLDAAKMALAKERMAVLHPLPRVNEIAVEVDADPRAAYFRQVEYGKFVRMALITKLLEWKERDTPSQRGLFSDAALRCTNPKCITNADPRTPRRFRRQPDGTLVCACCDAKAASLK
jgi:aspartate carbamoyltransferase catalytic subunit